MEHNLEQLIECPSCGNTETRNHLTCTDFTYSQDLFTIVKCQSCALLFTNPRPDESSIGPYYDNPEYVSHTDTSSGLLFKLYGAVKQYTLTRKRVLMGRLSNGRKILDYGAGSGDFSNQLANNGWTVTSFEPDGKARSLIKKKNNSIRLIDTLDSLETGSQSIITLWHVLEHVHKLRETISQFDRILSKDGRLIIAVPNYTSYDARFYKEHWAAYDVPRHLYHFDLESIQNLMSSLGFKLVETKPMWFDSYYVSLLSEKNRNANNIFQSIIGWPRAFVIGAISNLIALGSTNRCSSITYIFEKAV